MSVAHLTCFLACVAMLAYGIYITVLQFVDHVGTAVPRSSIEQVLPYDLIRSAYLAAYEASQFGTLDHGTDGAETPGATAGD